MKKFVSKVGLHPLFILLGLGLIALGYGKIFFIYLSVVILHEMAHAVVAKKLGYKLGKIYLQPFGAGLSISQEFASEKDEIAVAVAGPLLNFILAFLCIALWWIEPVIYNYTQEFVFANFITGLVNLLPCYPMDGGRIFVGILNKKLNRKKSLKICFIFNYIFTIFFLIFFFYSIFKDFNITYLLMAIFIFLGTIDGKFSGSYSLAFNGLNPKIAKRNNIPIKTFAVKSEIRLFELAKNLANNKFNIVYVIFENKNVKILTQNSLENLILNSPLTEKLENLFKQKNI